MRVSIKSLNGTNNEIDVEASLTVMGLKEIICKKEGLNAKQIRLILKGKLLMDDNKKLGECGVTEGACLHTALMMR